MCDGGRLSSGGRWAGLEGGGGVGPEDDGHAATTHHRHIRCQVSAGIRCRGCKCCNLLAGGGLKTHRKQTNSELCDVIGKCKADYRKLLKVLSYFLNCFLMKILVYIFFFLFNKSC